MAALANPSRWRTHPYQADVKAWLYAPPVVLAAHVDTSLIQYPLSTVVYDTVTVGGYSALRVGMTVLLGSTPGGDDLGRSYLRGEINTNSFGIGRASRGFNDGEVNLTTGATAYVTVLDDYRVWAKMPNIGSSGVRFTDQDRDFATYHRLVPLVRLNCGAAVQSDVNPATGKATFSFSATATATEPGAIIGSYAYTLPSGATVTAGATNTSAVTFTLPQGVGYLHCVVTDSYGTTNIRHVLLVAETNSNVDGWELSPWTIPDDGQTISLKFNAPIPRATYPDGTMLVLWQKEVYGGVAGSLAGPSGSEHMLFAGWMDTEGSNQNGTARGLLTDTAVKFVDAAGRAKQLMVPPVNTGNESGADSWDEMVAANLDKLMVRRAHEYSTLLTLCDFTWSGTGATFKFIRRDTSGGNLWDALASDARGMAGRYVLTFDEWGRMAVKLDPQLVDSGSRTATEIVGLLESDWTDIRAGRRRPASYRFLWGDAEVPSSANASDTTTIAKVYCVAPGKVGGPGTTESTENGFLATETQLVETIKHRYARLTSPDTTFDVDLAHGGNAGISPAAKEWVPLTISAATAAERGLTLTSGRMLPLEVWVSYDAKAGTFKRSVTLERETVGVGCEAYTPKQAVEYTLPPITPPGLDWGLPPVNPPGELVRGTQTMIGFNDDGYLYYCGPILTGSGFDVPVASGGPLWARVAAQANCIDAVQDAFTRTRAIEVTTDAAAIYTVDNIGPAPIASLVKTLRAAITDTATQWRMVDASFGGDYIVVVSFYGNSGADSGTWYTYSLDGGATWSTETNITANYNSGTPGGKNVPGLFVSSRAPGEAYVGAYATTGSDAGAAAELYKLSGNFASHAGTGISTIDIIPSSIHKSWADNEATLYYGAVDFSLGLSTRNFLYRKVGSGSSVDITPVIGGNKQRPFFSRGLHSCALDAATLLAAVGGNTTSGVVMSRDKGTTWTQLSAGTTTDYNGAEVAGDNPDAGFVWGDNGAIGYVDLVAQTIDSRMGNLATDFPSIGRFVRIMGG